MSWFCHGADHFFVASEIGYGRDPSPSSMRRFSALKTAGTRIERISMVDPGPHRRYINKDMGAYMLTASPNQENKIGKPAPKGFLKRTILSTKFGGNRQ
jgi:hypothetical protein